MKRPGFDLHSLSAQMILSFIALVLLTAAAVGLPAIWLIHDQLARQAWAQVEQGRRATQALYAARQSEIEDLATLTAQRPTLWDLLAKGDRTALSVYLRTLQSGAGLDLVLVCDAGQQPVAQAKDTIADALCEASTEGGLYIVSGQPARQVWLVAAHSVEERIERVIVGVVLDDSFAMRMRDQTGLEHTLLVDGEPVATTLAEGGALYASCQQVGAGVAEGACRVTFSHDGVPYYAVHVPLGEPGIETGVALPVSDIVATQRRLVWTLVGGIWVVAIVGSGTGAFLARRIGRPLAHLTSAATALREGDLSRPIEIETGVREVALVAQALESARSDLEQAWEQLRREKDWTTHLLEAIVEGIVTFDRHGRITFFSHGAERITGWKREQVMGRTCDEVFRPLETDEPFSLLIPPPGRRQKIPVELCDDRQAILAITGAQLLPPGGGDAQMALVFRDVSEAEAIHRLLGHFLANVAHEFRTPLAAVAASAELLLDQAADLNAAELNELLISLHLGVLGLQTLVDNLLQSASIEAGHFRVSPRACNLGEIIAEAIRTMQPLLDKRGQRLMVELPAAIPVVQADFRRMVQVLVNLLSNAGKYGPDEGEIVVSATMAGDWVRVLVADQGPGIPLEQHDDAFRRFRRLDSEGGYGASPGDKAQYGAGLGLSVVKAVVEAHGGQVGVDDRPGGGSVFWFTLRVSER